MRLGVGDAGSGTAGVGLAVGTGVGMCVAVALGRMLPVTVIVSSPPLEEILTSPLWSPMGAELETLRWS